MPLTACSEQYKQISRLYERKSIARTSTTRYSHRGSDVNTVRSLVDAEQSRCSLLGLLPSRIGIGVWWFELWVG